MTVVSIPVIADSWREAREQALERLTDPDWVKWLCGRTVQSTRTQLSPISDADFRAWIVTVTLS